MLLRKEGKRETNAVMCRLQAIAGSPELYPELIRLGGLPHILALLSHDNSDIAASAIQLLRELTDADAIEDSVRRPPFHAHKQPGCNITQQQSRRCPEPMF